MTDAASAGVGNFEFTVDGRRVYCVTQGTGDEVFVLVPGYAADHTTWLLTQPALATKGKVYAPDLPGAGLSSLDVGAGDIAFFAGIVRALMDHAGIARAHLVGHSMGASIAVAVATERSEPRLGADADRAGRHRPVDQHALHLRLPADAGTSPRRGR